MATDDSTLDLDFHAALDEILSEADMSEEELAALLGKIAAMREAGTDHLCFDELQSIEALPETRQAHARDCEYCKTMLQVIAP